MRCPVQHSENFDLLLEYCSAKLSPGLTAAFDEHLQSCADCRTFVSSQSKLWDDLDSWEPEPVSPAFDRSLYAKITEHEQLSFFRKLWLRFWQPGPNWWGPAVPIATACLTVLLAVFFYMPGTVPSSDYSNQPEVLTVLKGDNVDAEQADRALEDIEMLRQLAPAPSAPQTL